MTSSGFEGLATGISVSCSITTFNSRKAAGSTHQIQRVDKLAFQVLFNNAGHLLKDRSDQRENLPLPHGISFDLLRFQHIDFVVTRQHQIDVRAPVASSAVYIGSPSWITEIPGGPTADIDDRSIGNSQHLRSRAWFVDQPGHLQIGGINTFATAWAFLPTVPGGYAPAAFLIGNPAARRL